MLIFAWIIVIVLALLSLASSVGAATKATDSTAALMFTIVFWSACYFVSTWATLTVAHSLGF